MRTRVTLAAAMLAFGVASIANAQYQPGLREAPHEARFEIVPIAGYMWGGSAGFDAQNGQPGGEFSINDGVVYGVDVGIRYYELSWLELFYRRHDNKLTFRQTLTGQSVSGDFATNYIHIGGRQEFHVGDRVKPYIRGSLGMTIFDPQFGDLGTSTKFSLSLGGGFTYMLKNERVGIRGNLQGWFTFVPTNEVGIYCDPFFPYYCYAATGSQTVSQGEVTGGLVFRF